MAAADDRSTTSRASVSSPGPHTTTDVSPLRLRNSAATAQLFFDNFGFVDFHALGTFDSPQFFPRTDVAGAPLEVRSGETPEPAPGTGALPGFPPRAPSTIASMSCPSSFLNRPVGTLSYLNSGLNPEEEPPFWMHYFTP